MKKIVMIHTSPVSLNDLKALVKQYMPDVELVNIIDDSLLEEVKKNNGPTPNVIKLRNDGFEGNTKNVLLFFLWKI